MAEKTQDPNGVPRPVEPDRVTKAGGNSGIIVGETSQPTMTTAGTQQDNYKTAFIKVYQDAGVIGLAMLTLLALCLLSTLFAGRVLKMYSSLVSANAALVQASADATIKVAESVLLLKAEISSAVAEIRREHDEQTGETRKLTEAIHTLDTRATAAFGTVTQAIALVAKNTGDSK